MPPLPASPHTYWLSARGVVVGWKRSMSTVWAAGAIVLLVASLYYPAAAAATKSNFFNGEPTLDGLDFVRSRGGGEYAAIEFVKDNVRPGSGIVEAVGEWFDAGLISRSTGVPTVLNWPGHQLQWRGSADPFDGREADIARIYETEDPLEARNLLAKYDVDYVYVGLSRALQARRRARWRVLNTFSRSSARMTWRYTGSASRARAVGPGKELEAKSAIWRLKARTAVSMPSRLSTSSAARLGRRLQIFVGALR